jgi:hypothetical protein
MYMQMKRKQIYMDAASERRIRALARTTKLSEAEHIRRAVAAYTANMRETTGRRHPLLDMIGLCDEGRGHKDGALHHDVYLYGRKR